MSSTDTDTFVKKLASLADFGVHVSYLRILEDPLKSPLSVYLRNEWPNEFPGKYFFTKYIVRCGKAEGRYSIELQNLKVGRHILGNATTRITGNLDLDYLGCFTPDSKGTFEWMYSLSTWDDPIVPELIPIVLRYAACDVAPLVIVDTVLNTLDDSILKFY